MDEFNNQLKQSYHYFSPVPSIHGEGRRNGGKNIWFQPWKNAWFQPFAHLQWQLQRILISLGLIHNLHRWRRQWLEALEKWPCGDCLTFYSAMLHDDVWIIILSKTTSTVVSWCKIMEKWNSQLHACAKRLKPGIFSAIALPFAMNAGYEASLYLCLIQILMNNQGWKLVRSTWTI